jgi:tRNA threonylcarbamoyladenosine biosynthesis protein TsaB
MPLTLAIDCALRQINLGAMDGDKILGSLSAEVGTKQSEILGVAVKNFLRSIGFKLDDIGLIAVTTGPGYYTGIRIGVSYACALAWSLGVKVAPVPTLRAMAFGVGGLLEAIGMGYYVAPVITAGRDSFYAAVYRMSRDGEMISVSEPSHVNAEGFVESLSIVCMEPPPVIVGNDLSSELIKKSGYRTISPVPEIGISIAKISRVTEAIDPRRIKANYLRSPS